MWSDLRYLIGTFDPRSRNQLFANVFAQFFLALMDLLGVAAIYPLMQVAMGKNIDEGTLGTLHRLLGSQDKNHFAVTLAALMALSFLIKAVLTAVLQWWGAGVVTRLQTGTSRKLLQSYMSEGYLEHRRRNTGEVIRTVGAATQAAHQNVLSGFIGVLSTLMSVVAIGTLLIVVTPVTALCAALYFAVAVFIIQRVLGPANRRAGEAAQHSAWLSSKTLMEAMHGFREANLHGAKSFFVDRYDHYNVANSQAARKANFLAQLPKNLLEFVTMIGLTILIVASVLSGNAESTMPILSLFAAATVKVLPLMVSLTATIGNIRFGREGLHITVAALRGMPRTAGESASRGRRAGTLVPHQSPLPVTSDLEIRHVSFSYEDGAGNVLNDINLQIPHGTSMALCGPSGSGKTTLVDIILGLMSPSEGRVTYGGVRTDANDRRWFDAVAYVPQDVYLLDDTLANNVAFGIPEADQDPARIGRCLERAELGDVVDSLKDGIRTEIGERGTRLSGGQRQRLGIARALYRGPQVIVFDEATSALDNATEHKITSTINGLRGEITTIIVAHRLSTVRDVDALAYLRDGHVEAYGTFSEVEAQSPSFANLVRLGRLDAVEPPAGALDMEPSS